MSLDVRRVGTAELTEEERDVVESIGRDNIDYCVLTILRDRHEDLNFSYDEENSRIFVSDGDEEVDYHFDKELIQSSIEKMEEALKKVGQNDFEVDWVAEDAEGIESLLKYEGLI